LMGIASLNPSYELLFGAASFPIPKLNDSINPLETTMGANGRTLWPPGDWPMLSREERNPLSDWWWTVDRPLLGAIIALMLSGIVLSLAASPAVAVRIGLDPFHFFNHHVMFLLPSFIVLIGVSFLSPKQIRRSALIVFAISIVLIVATLLIGPEVKGSRRWITLLGLNIQASESAKPAFVVVAAWLFSESTKKPEMPATSMAVVLLLMFVALLVMEPDFGQTMLTLMVWGALFFIAGMRMVWVFGLAGAASAGLFLAYLLVPHVAGRIQRFMNPASGDTFQVDTAMEAFGNGGWFGLGPGEGIAKRSLPDSHTDFVFAVAAEEFGIVLCLALLALFAFVVIRALSRAYANEDMFARFAASGLAIMFGVQAAINMAVNLQLIPAKGMTLPFISYGGSSIVSLAYGVGMMLALTRLRPRSELASLGGAGTAPGYA
jgi:cell division protein FtsW